MRRLGLTLLLGAALAGTSTISACNGNIGSALPNAHDDGQSESPICTDGGLHPGIQPIRRLTSFEYDNTMRDLLGDQTHPSAPFPPDEVAGGFDNNAQNLTVSDDLAEKYMAAAEGISERATADLGKLTGCSTFDNACATQFIDSFGKRAFRRPLTPDQRAALIELFSVGREQASVSMQKGTRNAELVAYTQGIRMVIEGVVQSPELMYRVEPVDPTLSGDTSVPLDSYEMASRLSYFLWGSMPDDQLFAAADAGGLITKDDVAAQARRMLADPKARLAVGEFHNQWLGYQRIQGATKDPAMFPDWSPAIATLMQEETRQFIEHAVFDDGGDLNTLLTAPFSYMNADLADFYGVPHPSATGSDFVRVDLDPTQHAGLLTLGSLMAWYAHTNQTSPVHRGLLVREQLLCDTLPPPPMMFQAPVVDPNDSTRERFSQHSTDPACAGCHTLMDPIGFGFENIDAVGRYRTSDAGLPVDASGALTETDVDGPFNGAIELSQKLAVSEQVQKCYADQWFRWTQGRGETTEDACSIDQIDKVFQRSSGNIEELIVALTQTDAFLYRKNGAVQ